MNYEPNSCANVDHAIDAVDDCDSKVFEATMRGRSISYLQTCKLLQWNIAFIAWKKYCLQLLQVHSNGREFVT